MFNENLIAEQEDIYVVDLGVAHKRASSPAISFNHTQKATWMLHTNVLLPAAQIIDLAIAEQEDMAIQLAGAIQHAYGSGVWADELRAQRIQAIKLNGLHKLQYGPEKRFFEGDASFAMLLEMHSRFLTSAIEMMELAKADKVEESYAVLTTHYARASRQVVWLLKNLKRRMRYARVEEDQHALVLA